ncbi:hypothetical protein HPB48_022735 [Haemaphysalis longicornis]|uniref:Nuclease HARBI1 n=1 Tax=Haemaphysalis longicornis TaxID=44386 RepID=A0A9J6GLE6_HAELO|nr:hypothetical protein HPB48_022735 [Haemaphysalis longicornis]
MAVHLPLVFASLAAQEAQQVPRRQLRWPRRQHTPRDAFALSDEEFVRKFRLAKSAVRTLCGELRDRLEPQRAGGLSTETKVLCALRFFATGSYQNLVGSDESVGVSQASVSRCVRAVSTAIVAVGTEKGWVRFPTTAEEKAATKKEFLRLGNIDGVVGCVDGTLVAVTKPENLSPGETQGFWSRKGYYALNVMIVSTKKKNAFGGM